MNKSRTWLVILSSLLVVAMLVTGCSKKTTTSTTTTTTSEEVQTLKIGVFNTLVGFSAGWGQPALDVANMQVDAVNAAGGLLVGGKRYKFQVIFYEVGNDATLAVTKVQQAINQDHINFAVSGLSPEEAARIPYLQAAKIPFVEATAGTDVLAPDPYGFNVNYTFKALSDGFFPVIKEKEPAWQKFARITLDVSYDHDLSGCDQAAMAANGLTFLGEAVVDPSTTDFAPAITKVIAMKPDCILLGCDQGQVVDMIRQIREAGWKGGVADSFASYAAPDIIAALKGVESYADGFYNSETAWYPTPPEMVAFQAAYVKYTGHEYMLNAAVHWYEVQVLFQGLQDAGTVSDPDKIAQAIANCQIKSPYAPGNPTLTFGGTQTWGRKVMLQIPYGISKITVVNGVATATTAWTGSIKVP